MGHMSLIDSLAEGNFIGVSGKPDRTIETLLSKLFFFGDRVYKIYKWNKAFYGDLSDLSFRREYIHEDFFWNAEISPDIYLKLLCVKQENGDWKEVASEAAEDFCIVMKTTEADQTMTVLAENGQLGSNMLEMAVQKMIPRARTITEKRRDVLAPFLNLSLKDTLQQELQDLREWAYMGHEFISHAETDQIIDTTLKASLPISYFNDDQATKMASIDGNPDNVLILRSGEVKLIDIMPPKLNWRVADEFFNICRYGAEVSIFMGEEAAKPLYETYFKMIGKRLPDEVRRIYELRAAFIQVPYRFVIGQKARAEKSLAFVKKRLAEI